MHEIRPDTGGDLACNEGSNQKASLQTDIERLHERLRRYYRLQAWIAHLYS